jgi:integrase
MRTYRPKYTVDGVVHTSQRWWIDLHDHRGVRRRLAGLADRRATEAIGRNIERLVRYVAAGEPPDPALAKWLADLPAKLQRTLADIGLLDRTKVAVGCPLVEHLDGTADLPGFHQSLVAKGATTLYTTILVARVRRILAGCEFSSWHDINPSRVMAYLDGRRAGPDGIGPQTFNSYLVAFKLFCSWMVHDGRANRSPVDHLEGLNVRVDRRHDRRALSVEELRRLLDAARNGAARFGMAGPERALLYKLAVETGLRARELANLTPASFALDGDQPVVRVRAAYSKRRREDVLPLRSDTAMTLRVFLAGRPVDAPAFAMPLGRLAAMIRADLASARQAWLDELRPGPERDERERSSGRPSRKNIDPRDQNRSGWPGLTWDRPDPHRRFWRTGNPRGAGSGEAGRGG